MDKYINKKIGIYIILDKTEEKASDGYFLYLCQCLICGKKFKKKIFRIIESHKECRHNIIRWRNSRMGHIFIHMRDRCYNFNNKDYRFYGHKGIKICQEWLDNPKLFEEWAFNNGYREDLTIDRIDSSKDYSPQNCRWISKEENTRRAGNVNWLTINGITLTGRQWAEKLKIGTNYINRKIREEGVEKVVALISAILKDPFKKENIPSNVSLFKIYNI